MNKRLKGNLFILLTAFCWSLAGLLIRLVSWNGTLIAGVTCLIAYVMVSIYRRSFKVKFTKFVVFTAFCSCMTNLTFVYANQMTTAANAIVLQYVSPLFCLLYGCLYYRTKPTVKQFLVIMMALSGLVLFFFGKLDQGAMLGNLLAILSGVFFGAVFFLNTLPKANPLDSTMISYMFQILLALPFFVSIPPVSSKAWIAILLIGLIQMGLSGITFAIGIRNTDSISANLIGLLETIMSPLWVLLAYGEKPGTYALFGGSLLLGAVVLNVILGQREIKKAKRI
ncbi:MAG: DMT family transporter [Erysipelotrichaceae bacterium]